MSDHIINLKVFIVVQNSHSGRQSEMMNVTEAILLIYGDHLSLKTFNVFPNQKIKNKISRTLRETVLVRTIVFEDNY